MYLTAHKICHVVGYELTGTMILACTSERTWDSPLPECVPVTCKAPTITNGQVTTTGPYFWTDTAKYTCQKGEHFILHG